MSPFARDTDDDEAERVVGEDMLKRIWGRISERAESMKVLCRQYGRSEGHELSTLSVGPGVGVCSS